jgi:starch synthase
MRVLFANENLGGHATVHTNLARELAGREDVCAEFVNAPPMGMLRKAVAYPMPGLSRLDLDLHSLRFQLVASLAVRGEVRSRARFVDVLHIYSHTLAWTFPGLQRTLPTVVSTDASNRQNMALRANRRAALGTPLTAALIDRFERRVLAAATLVIAQSNWAAEGLRVAGVPEDRLRVVRYGVPLPAVLPHHQATDLPEITFVGKTMDRKGGWMLLEAFRARFAGRAQLNLVTEEAVPSDEWVKVHRNIRPGDGKLAAILARSSVFVLPTDTDMSPNAILEAMAAGVPVIATSHAAIPEMVLDGDTGRLVPVRDPRALGDALDALLADPSRLRAMGERGFDHARATFDVARTTADLELVLAEAIARFRPRDATSGVDP